MFKVRIIPATTETRSDGAYLDEPIPFEGSFLWPSQWKLHIPFPFPESFSDTAVAHADDELHEIPILIIEEGISRLFLIDTPHAVMNDETINLNIDSHYAFGDGKHPTTELCIHLLGKIVASIPPEKRDSLSFIDVGTGSGVLAIIAKKSGIGKVDAIDIVEDAVRCAKANARLNECALNIACNDIAQFKCVHQYDIIAANIVTDVFLKNTTSIVRLLKKNGYLIASGISTGSASLATACFIKHGLVIQEILFWRGWSGFIMQMTC